MKAERLQTGEVKLSGKAWFDIFPEEKLTSWIWFYEKMFKDYNQPTYKHAADALKALSASKKGAE